MTIRILLVDDQRLLRHGLRMILEEEEDDDLEVVGEAGDGAGAVAAAARPSPDVILMDIRMLAPAATRRLIDQFADDHDIAGLEPPEGLDLLTDRESGVMDLIVEGLSNAEIGARLHLSETTVKTHVGRVLMKLGCRDRVQLVVLAYERGIVRPGGHRWPARG